MFSALQTIVKCRQCDSDIIFSRYGQRGLYFKIKIQCQCEDRYIASCHMINNAFEVNRRVRYAIDWRWYTKHTHFVALTVIYIIK